MSVTASPAKRFTIRRSMDEMNGFTSLRLGIRFKADDFDVRVFGPAGREFRSPDEIANERGRLAAKLRELGVDPDSIT